VIYYLLVPVFSLFLIVFQTTIPGILFFETINVELSLILVIYAGFHLGALKGGILCFVLGFMLDCMTGTVSGFFVLLYILIFTLSLLVSLRVYAARVSFIMGFTMLCALLEGLMIAALYLSIYRMNVLPEVMRIIVPQALLLAVLSPALFNLLHRIEVALSNGTNTRPA
jgi:cell shape-determining protein MreD